MQFFIHTLTATAIKLKLQENELVITSIENNGFIYIRVET